MLQVKEAETNASATKSWCAEAVWADRCVTAITLPCPHRCLPLPIRHSATGVRTVSMRRWIRQQKVRQYVENTEKQDPCSRAYNRVKV